MVADQFTPSGALIKAVIIHSGRPMKYRVFSDGSTSDLMKYPSVEQGYGRLDLRNVLRYRSLKDEHLSVFIKGAAWKNEINYVSLKFSGENHTYSFRVADVQIPQPLRVTLAYTDIASYPAQSHMRVNKIRMYVMSNASRTVFSRLNSDWDDDNVIVVDILNPVQNTTYTVYIIADFLIEEQSYAIVMTGEFNSNAENDINNDDVGVQMLQKSFISPFLRKLILCILLVILIVAGFAKQLLKIDYTKSTTKNAFVINA